MGGLSLFLLSYSFFLALASPTPDLGQDPSENPCFPTSPCGLNTECLVDNGEAACYCMPNYVPVPDSDPQDCEEVEGGLPSLDDPFYDDELLPIDSPTEPPLEAPSDPTPATTTTTTPSPSPTLTPCFLPKGTPGSCVSASSCPSASALLTGFKENVFTNDLKLLLKQSLFCPKTSGKICCPNTDIHHEKKRLPQNKAPAERDYCQLQNGDHAMCVQLTSCSPFMELMAGLKKPKNASVVPSFIRSAFLCGAANGLDGRKHARVCCPVQALKRLPEPTGYAGHPGRSQLAPSDGCGIAPAARIVGGRDAKPGQFPWLANLGYGSGGKLSYKCGGTLIGKRWVLTAAHCVTGLPRSMKVGGIRLGEHKLSTDVDCPSCPPVQNFGVEEILYHPEYNKPRQFMNDIALLKLDREAEYNDYVQPICLPWWDDHEDYTLNTFAGNRATIEVAGWGATGATGSNPADVLQYLEVPIFEQTRCTETYKQRGATLEEKQLCAGGERGKDSCSGDSGSGLMRRVMIPVKLGGVALDEERSQLIGAVSFGPSFCGTNNVPGVYARVNSYLNWILQTVADNA